MEHLHNHISHENTAENRQGQGHVHTHTPHENTPESSHGHTHRHHHGHSHTSFSIDQCAYRSALIGVNPGFKVAFCIISLIFLLVADSLPVSLVMFISMLYLTVRRGRVPFHDYVSYLAIPAIFTLMTVVVIAIGFSFQPLGDYRIHLGFFYVFTSVKELWKAFCLLCKIFSAISCMYFLSLSTPVNEIICVLQDCHLPSLITELMNMIYRFIFILMDVWQKMSTSAHARLGYVDYRTSLNSFGRIGANLFIVSMRKANQYYDALLARCYDGQLNFLTEEKPLDKKLVAMAAVFYLFLLTIRILVRI